VSVVALLTRLAATCGQDGRHEAPASGGSCRCGLVTRIPAKGNTR
jgi:hypothetical protein